MNDLMSAIWMSYNGPLVDAIGWLLLHSVWQFAFIGAAIFVVLGAMRKSSAWVRYHVLLTAMLVVVAAPVMTTFWMMQDVGQSHSTWSYKHGANNDYSIGQVITYEDPRSVSQAQATTLENPNSVPGVQASKLTQSAAASIEPMSQPAEIAAAALNISWYQQVTKVLAPWIPAIVFVWMFGILVCAIRPLFGWLIVVRLRRVGTTAVPENIQTLFQNTMQRMQVKPIVSLLQSSLIQIPVVVGYFKPVILLPVSVVAELPVKQIEAILAHELAHVKRFDYVVNILQTVVETVFFYHPAVWWLSHQIRIEREHCCDDDVVRILDNRRDYGHALLAMTELKSHGGALAIGVGGSSLLTRVRRLCGIEPVQRSWAKFLACSLVLLIGAGALGAQWQVVAAEENPREFDVTAKLISDTNEPRELLQEDEMTAFQIPDETLNLVRRLATEELKKPWKIEERRPPGLEQLDTQEDIERAIRLAIDDLSRLADPRADQKSDPRVRLRYLGDSAFELMAQALDSSDTTVALQVCSLLGQHGERAVKPLIRVLETHPSKSVRSAAARGLGQTFHPDALEPLIAALDHDESVRVAAASALGCLRDRRAIEPLKKRFSDPNGHIAVGAVENILAPAHLGYVYWPADMLNIRALTIDAHGLKGESFGRAEIDILLSNIDSENGSIGAACSYALNSLHRTEAIAQIISAQRSSSSRNVVLASMPTPDALEALFADLQSTDMRRKEMALSGLSDGAGRWAAPLLIEFLDDESLKTPARSDAEEVNVDIFVTWPESHTAHTRLWGFFSRHGLPCELLNLAEGKTNDVPAEIAALKVWWQQHGRAFLEGRKVPNPKITLVWFSS